MLWRLLLIGVWAGSLPSASVAQDIVLSDTSPPTDSSLIFSGTCGTRYHSALELSSTDGKQRVIAHSNDKISSVTSPHLLAKIWGYDLYSVRMQCAESGGQFRIDVRKEDGQFVEQVITVHGDSSALVEPAHLVKGARKSSLTTNTPFKAALPLPPLSGHTGVAKGATYETFGIQRFRDMTVVLCAQ